MSDAATTVTALGRRFVEAVANKDAEAVGAVLHPEVDFRALTPNRFWEAHDRDAVLEILFGTWFQPPTNSSSCSCSPTPLRTASRSASASADAAVRCP